MCEERDFFCQTKFGSLCAEGGFLLASASQDKYVRLWAIQPQEAPPSGRHWRAEEESESRRLEEAGAEASTKGSITGPRHEAGPKASTFDAQPTTSPRGGFSPGDITR